jgi:diacylglycerol kinase family enzyme
MKFCFIYNKKTSGGNESNFISKIYKKIEKRYLIDFFETKNEKEASIILNNLKKNNYDRLILAGGDGTVSFAINELIKNNHEFSDNFSIGYVPVGTVNILKFELNINKKVDSIVKTLVSNNIKKVNLIKTNDKYFILMAGIGWDAQVVESITSPIKKILGKIIFVFKGLEKLLFMRKDRFNVFVDGEKIYSNWVLCCNSMYYAGNYQINKTSIFEKKFITFIVKDLSRFRLIYLLYVMLRYKDLSRAKGVICKISKNISIESLSKGLPLQVDGDFWGQFNKINISKSNININFISG